MGSTINFQFMLCTVPRVVPLFPIYMPSPLLMLQVFHGYKHKCAAAFKHHRGPNFVDGLNTSYAESANAYTQSLKATVAKWGTLGRATLYTEFFMMVYNLGREQFSTKITVWQRG